MSGEKQPAVYFFNQVAEHGVRDGVTVESACSSAEFIEDDQRVLSGVLENGSCFGALDIERACKIGFHDCVDTNRTELFRDYFQVKRTYSPLSLFGQLRQAE